MPSPQQTYSNGIIKSESVTRLATAFQNLHKLRAGMVRPERDSIGAHVQQVANKSEKWLTYTAMEKLLDQYRIAMARDWQKLADLRHSAKRSTPHNALHNRMELTEQGYPPTPIPHPRQAAARWPPQPPRYARRTRRPVAGEQPANPCGTWAASRRRVGMNDVSVDGPQDDLRLGMLHHVVSQHVVLAGYQMVTKSKTSVYPEPQGII